MKYLLRPHHNPCFNVAVAALAAAVLLAFAPPAARAQAQDFAPFLEDPNLLLAHAGTVGYLGVDVSDVDQDKAQALKLKEVRGALITLIDHDAPAGQIGLKVNDVVLAINGQNVENAEALRRILRELPPGRKVSMEISRDGNIQTLAVQLVDRKAMEHDIWARIGIDVDGIAPPAPPPGMGVLSGSGTVAGRGGLHMSLFTSTLKVGAIVEPLTSQMAEYLGVQGGLMVKQVAKKSEAAAAGLKAFDVILKVGSDSINTSADWDRALRSNAGKPVQVTILRDRKQQILTLQVDSKHRGAVEFDDLFGSDDGELVAEITPLFDFDLPQPLSAQAAADAQAATEEMSAQVDHLSGQIGGLNLQINPDQMKQLRKQTEKLRESMKDFKIDPEEMEQLRRQVDEFRKNFNSDEMKQVEKQLQQQMEQFRRQMEEWREQNQGHFV